MGAKYLRSLNIDEPFIRQTSIDNEHYHTDVLGSSLTLSNTQGIAGTGYTYEPFGKTAINGTSANPFQYTARENDGNGLYYYRARYYSPTLLRFLSEDPIGISGGDLNFYSYVRNNPVNLVDPDGNQFIRLGPGGWSRPGPPPPVRGGGSRFTPPHQDPRPPIQEPLPPSPVRPQPEWPVPPEELIGKHREPHQPHDPHYPGPNACHAPDCLGGGAGSGIHALPPVPTGGGGPQFPGGSRNPGGTPLGQRKDPSVPSWLRKCAMDPFCS